MLTVMHVNLAKGFRGGERQTELLISALSNYPDVIQVLACRSDSPLREKLKHIRHLTFLDSKNQLDGHCKNQHADIVHAHEAKAVHWAYIYKLIHKTPYILTRRIDAQVKEKYLNKKTYSNASALVGISTLISNNLRAKNWGAVYQVPSVLANLESNPNIGEEFKKTFPNKKIIGHVGALVDKHKGQKVLIEAAQLLEDTHPDLHFVFFGNGVDEEEFKSLSKHSKNITWMGFKENIGDFLPYFDIFAFPSRNEGLGSTLLDVMNANVPIIASNVGGIPDIVINNVTGVLIEPNDSEVLKNAIIQLSTDEPLQARLVAGAKDQLEKYTPEKMAQSYITIYNSCRVKK
ncbi:glycosyltransferase family 4 protein [Marinomonas sp. A79]|uniref:Glycosyltransferase family 4 protein n=1 Tax=Marinomonas vulgaris TaxID=2823372 RepID=A0ABS5HAP8_9GAMM|nr:glycosyltransferase family 4 protein [Marinomonas vulgaris]